jgi:hypothetical protein
VGKEPHPERLRELDKGIRIWVLFWETGKFRKIPEDPLELPGKTAIYTRIPAFRRFLP